MGDESYRPLIENMTWSFSRIKSFDECPYRWFLQYIIKCPETPMWYAGYGSFMHKLVEQYYKGELSKEEMQIKYLFDFQKEVQGERPSESTVRKYIDAGLSYLKSFVPFPFNAVAVEKKVIFDINGIPFVGYIDYLGEKDGEYYIVDNKSRDLKPRSGRSTPTLKDRELDEMLKQLYLYSAAVRQEFGKFPKALCFNCFRSGSFIMEEFDEGTYNETTAWATRYVEDIKNTGDFRPHADYFACRFICGVSNECCYKEE